MDKPFHLHILLLVSSLFTLHLPPDFFSETTRPEKTAPYRSLGSAAVAVQATPSGSVPNQLTGYCQTGQTTVTFTNEGMANDPAQSIITDLSLGIALGDGFQLQDGGFEITTITIAGVSIPGIAPLNNIADSPLFASDPDGAGGLSDTDGDGFFDDLELGQSVEITASYEFDCGQAANIDLPNNCQNDASTSLNARMQYMENGQMQAFQFDNYLRPANEGISFETLSDPDAFAGVDTFKITHTISRSIRSFEDGCGNDGEFHIHIDLPNDILPVTNQFALLRNGENPLPLLDVQATATTLDLVYDASFFTILSGEYSLEMVFTSTCFAALGASAVPVTFSHFCPACSCEHVWYCGDVEGPHFHTSAPPCPGEVLLDCDEGVQIRSFEVERQTLGFSDENFTVPFDADLANKKVAMPCDKVTMQFTSTVGTTSISDSVGVVINYSNPDGSANPDNLFLFENGNVTITNNGSAFNCSITSDMFFVSTTGANKTIGFNLHSCIEGLGFPLVEGDSINIAAEFSINPNGPISTDFLPVKNFRAYLYHEVDGEQLACDSFGEIFRVGRSRALYDFPNSTAGMPQGCQDGELHFRLFVPDNDFSSFFGNELRQAQKIDSFVLDFNPILLEAYSPAQVMVSIPGHPVHGDSYFAVRPLSDFPDGHYVAAFDTLNYVPSLNMVEEYSFDLKINLTPTCLAEENSEIGLQSQLFYQDRFYANNIDGGSCVAISNEAGNSILRYNDPPELDIQPLTPASVDAQGGTAEWTVQVCNNSTSATADTVWFAIEENTGVLNVLAVENITNSANPINIPLTTYGNNNQFGIAPTLLPGNCIDLRLTANVDGCHNLDFSFVSGWTCGPFAQPNWTPDDNTCQEVSTVLNIINIGASPVSLQIDGLTSTCVNAGEEQITFNGFFVSTENIPTDNFTFNFIYDEDGDGQPQPGEPLLGQTNITAPLSAGNPLPINAIFSADVSEICNMFVTVEAANTDLCEGIELPLPPPVMANAGDDQTICPLNSPQLVTALGVTGCNGMGYTHSWSALPPADIAFLDDAQTAQPTLTIQWGNFLSETFTYVLETQRNGCGQSTFDTVQIFMPDVATGFFQNDSAQIQALSCIGEAEFCLGIDYSDLPGFQVEVDNNIFPPSNLTFCNGSDAAVPLTVGIHEVVLSDMSDGCSDTIAVTVTCPQSDTIDIALLLNGSDTFCLDANGLNGPIESVSNVCPSGPYLSYEIYQDTCVIFTGELVGGEMACYVACDGTGFCDTTYFNITVSHPIPDGLSDTIIISQNGEYCFDENLLNILGPVLTFENICPGQSGTAVNFNLDPIGNCVFYDGLDIGTEVTCLEFCDAGGNCDTVNYAVTVVPGNMETDSIFISIDTNSYCVDSMLLPGDIVSIEDICPENNAEEVFFEIDGNCVSYYGTSLGIDTACIRVEDEFGNVALINLVVTVVKTTPEVFCDTIFVGEVAEFCLDTFELPGIYQDYEILFDDDSPANAGFNLNPVNLCVRYEGLAVGQDSFSIALCDHYGFCDTTSLCITVKPYFDPPTLGADADTTVQETPIVVDPLANDTVFGGVVDYFILDPPISGTTTLNLDGSVSYLPDAGICERVDSFTYVVCNPNGCDTATISIFIECVELTIFNAVSPNNDGVNDYFYVSKILDFPDSRLIIYNRWGNKVFESGSAGYQNNWPGQWGNDIDLPDGTYYYILEWTGNEGQEVRRGYFEMYR